MKHTCDACPNSPRAVVLLFFNMSFSGLAAAADATSGVGVYANASVAACHDCCDRRLRISGRRFLVVLAADALVAVGALADLGADGVAGVDASLWYSRSYLPS